MFQINDTINISSFNDVSVHKILDLNATEALLVSMEKNAVFTKHTSPADATLLILEGCISIFIQNSEFKLSKNQIFSFPKDTEHWVEARENSNFLIIR